MNLSHESFSPIALFLAFFIKARGRSLESSWHSGVDFGARIDRCVNSHSIEEKIRHPTEMYVDSVAVETLGFFGDLPWSEVNAEGQVAQVIFGSHKGQEWPFQSHKKSPRLFGFCFDQELSRASFWFCSWSRNLLYYCLLLVSCFLCAHFSGHQNKDWN